MTQIHAASKHPTPLSTTQSTRRTTAVLLFAQFIAMLGAFLVLNLVYFENRSFS